MSRKAWASKEVIDPSTGEVHRLFYVLAPQDVDASFVKVFIPFLEELINDKDLVGKAFRLLLWVVQNLQWNDLRVMMNYQKVKEDLKISRATYYLWKKILIQKGILHPDPKSRETFYLKPYAVIRGSMTKIPEEQPLPFEREVKPWERKKRLVLHSVRPSEGMALKAS